jgi:hypothetical protein
MHPGAEEALCGLFDKMEGSQSHGNEDDVADPGIETGETEVIEDVVVVNEVPEVEMEQVEAVTGLSDEDQGRTAEGPG